jgi:hypothetical protein
LVRKTLARHLEAHVGAGSDVRLLRAGILNGKHMQVLADAIHRAFAHGLELAATDLAKHEVRARFDRSFPMRWRALDQGVYPHDHGMLTRLRSLRSPPGDFGIAPTDAVVVGTAPIALSLTAEASRRIVHHEHQVVLMIPN